MISIAVLGFGVIGQGIYEALKTNKEEITKICGDEVSIKYVLDRLSFKGHELENNVVSDIDIILNDDDISIVVESMGGENPAYAFSKAAIEKGKCVVTSNKLVVEKHGLELEMLAGKNNVSYLYEASVGGGIPIIHPLKKCLSVNKITNITGILNGTTNFILDKMETSHMSLEEAVSLGQSLGYAEKDPSSDIEGHDTARKICILSSIAFGSKYDIEDCSVIEGIQNISEDDIYFANILGYKIKLLGSATMTPDGKPRLWVSPCFIKKDIMLAAANGVFNAVSVTGNMVGEVIFYGQGAGSLTTASAVVSDITEIITCSPEPVEISPEKTGTVKAEEYDYETYIIINEQEKPAAEAILGLSPIMKNNGKYVYMTNNAGLVCRVRKEIKNKSIYYVI